MARVGIVYYSMYGSNVEMARTIAAGVEADGGTAELRAVPELLPDEVIREQGLEPVKEAQSDVPHARVDELPEFDGLIIGSPTRYGSATGQVQNFLDQTGPLFFGGELVGKTAGFFTGASTIHGGHETTILSLSTFAWHQGMVIVPAGYTATATFSSRTGGGPYGPTILAPTDGSKQGLSDEEAEIARAYGQRFHAITAKVAA